MIINDSNNLISYLPHNFGEWLEIDDLKCVVSVNQTFASLIQPILYKKLSLHGIH